MRIPAYLFDDVDMFGLITFVVLVCLRCWRCCRYLR